MWIIGCGAKVRTRRRSTHILEALNLAVLPLVVSPRSNPICNPLLRSAMLLMAYMHHMEFITPKMTRNYDVKAFRNDLKEVQGGYGCLPFPGEGDTSTSQVAGHVRPP